MAVGDSLDWLPIGWTKHVKLCNNRKVKSYIEPGTNRRFYSKPEVLRYLKHDSSKSKANATEDEDPYELQKLEEDCSQCNAYEKPDWLPDGWTMVLTPPRSSLLSSKTQKFIIDPLTGWKFFATPTEISYINAKSGHNETEQEKRAEGSKTDQMDLKPESSENLEAEKENDFSSEMENMNKHVYIERKNPDRLPQGWIKEIKVTRNSGRVRKDPYYTDPSSGYVFRSKKDALRYLATGDIYQCVMTPKKRNELKFLTDETMEVDEEDINSTKIMDYPNQETEVVNAFTSEQNETVFEQNETVFDDDSEEKIMVAQETPNNLPPGWTKEIKIQLKANGIIRKDPYYTDPGSGYVFRSEKDALRYLGSGDIRKCSIKPKKRDELEWLKGQTTPPPPTSVWKSSNQTRKRRLFTELPPRSSKRLSELKSNDGNQQQKSILTKESLRKLPSQVDEEKKGDGSDADSLENHQGSLKSDDENGDYESSDPVEDVCADPCIDFAYKTLTGAISIEKVLLQEASPSNLRPKTGPTNFSIQAGKPTVP